MSKFFESIVVLYSILISIVVTFAYLYFIFIPIKYIALNVLAWYDLPQEIAIYIHIITVSIMVLLGQIHVYKWFIRDYVTNERCDKCGNKVIVSNREKSSNCSIWVDPLVGLHIIQRIFREQLYRPRLHYTCDVCGHEECICPYCHKPVGENDKKCPHCRKRIFWVARGHKIA